ncbi:MAG: TIGR00725 family protein [bacterium]
MPRNQVSVIGSGSASEKAREEAYEVGQRLGNHGVNLVCGGGGGVMEAASRGISESEDGLAIGIRPETTDRMANEWLDVVIPSGIGQARNLSVVLSGRAIIAISGSYGTLSEISLARKFEKDLFGIGTWQHERFDFPTDLTPAEAVERAMNCLDA